MALNSSSFRRKLRAPSNWLKIKPSQTCNLIRWNSCMWNVNCYRCVFIVVVTGRENYDLLIFHFQLINLWNHFTDFDDDDCIQVQIVKKYEITLARIMDRCNTLNSILTATIDVTRSIRWRLEELNRYIF